MSATIFNLLNDLYATATNLVGPALLCLYPVQMDVPNMNHPWAEETFTGNSDNEQCQQMSTNSDNEQCQHEKTQLIVSDLDSSSVSTTEEESIEASSLDNAAIPSLSGKDRFSQKERYLEHLAQKRAMEDMSKVESISRIQVLASDCHDYMRKKRFLELQSLFISACKV